MLYTNCSRASKPTVLLGRAILAASLTAAVSTTAAALEGLPAVVRSSDPVLNELLAEGYSRSPSFRRLVDGLAETQTLVYVEAGVCAFGHLRACLLPFVATTDQVRYLRIVVTQPLNLGDRNRLISLIGHELQHALEVAVRPDVVDVTGLLEFARRNGFPLKGRPGSETSAARAAGDAVLDELRRSRSIR